MNTRICLVRHGVTDWNYAGRIQGRSDIPLAPEGSSDLITDARLAERNMGEAEGRLDVDLRMLWPGVPWDGIPGMEPVETVATRAHDALRDIAARHPGGRVICVGHGSLITTFVLSLVPPGVTPPMGTHQRNTSITMVHYDGERFTQAGAPDHRHILQDGIEYSGEKGRVSGADLEALLMGRQPGGTSLEPVIWGATAIESARVDDKLVGFTRAFTDGVLYGSGTGRQ